jgi:hypothetical protein
MPSYRFYFMTENDRIARGQNVECADDEEALRRARTLNHANAVEVWEGSRTVGRVDGKLPE